MRLIEFAGVTLPDAQHVSDLTRVAEVATLRPSGVVLGDYDLYGAQSPQGTQTYVAEFMFVGVQQAQLDALLALVGRRGTLKQVTWDGSVRRTEAKLVKVAFATTVEDKHASIQRVSCEFRAEPLWYAEQSTTINFTNATTVNLVNAGNARVVRHLVLTINTSLNGPLTVNITPANGQTATLQYLTTTNAPLVIDAGAHTVRVGANNAYANTSRPATQIPLLFLEPGNNTMTFNRTVSGSVVFRSAWR